MNILSIGYGRNLFDSDNPERKRMERCAREVESFHMIIFTLKKDGLSPVVTHDGLHIYPTDSVSKLHMVFDAIRIGKEIANTHEGDWVVTAQDPFEAGIAGLAIARSKKRPFNVQEHGDYFSTHHWRRDSWLNAIRYHIGIYILRMADTVRVVSKRTALTMERIGIAKSKLCFLPVRTDGISESAQKFDLATMYPHHTIRILSMGRLVSQKNLSLLIDAFANLYAKDQNALLLIVGSGSEEATLRAHVGTLGLTKSVIFIPWTDDPFSLMRSADIFALSSDWEGWARVLIEAMSAGTPVVTTDVGCAGEVLIDGRHGFVVPVGDTETFSKRLIQLASDKELQQRFGSQAQQDIAHIHLSLDVYARAWADVFPKTYEMYRRTHSI